MVGLFDSFSSSKHIMSCFLFSALLNEIISEANILRQIMILEEFSGAAPHSTKEDHLSLTFLNTDHFFIRS